MVDLKTLSEGDVLLHEETGALREINGFIKNFSGERDKAKLRPRRDITHKFDECSGKVAGYDRLESGDGDEWEVVEE